MSAGAEIPDADRTCAVVMQRHGLGWRVGLAPLIAGTIEGETSSHADERSAERAAVELADRLDLAVMRA